MCQRISCVSYDEMGQQGHEPVTFYTLAYYFFSQKEHGTSKLPCPDRAVLTVGFEYICLPSLSPAYLT